ncbi:MAG: hypothetical protein A2Y55_07985 [Actinobacteria bacterium RBG_16_68_12]|nr:MAG: hypothetical protein A2Y55_07985 [Actinobacteria bacterium RBG_16_68_12]
MSFGMRYGVLGVAVVAVLSSCGENSQAPESYSVADATRIANVRPVTRGWTWPQDPEQPVSSDAPTESAATDPLLAEFRRQTAELVDLGDFGSRWRDNNKLANLSVGVYGSASDAHAAMAPFNAFSRGSGEKTGGITKDEDIEGLGDEAWLLVGGSGTRVTYHWRRDNLVLEAHVDCFGYCPGDVDAATRAWVDGIDTEARDGS